MINTINNLKAIEDITLSNTVEYFIYDIKLKKEYFLFANGIFDNDYLNHYIEKRKNIMKLISNHFKDTTPSTNSISIELINTAFPKAYRNEDYFILKINAVDINYKYNLPIT